MKYTKWQINISTDDGNYNLPSYLLSNKLEYSIHKVLDNLKLKKDLVKLKNTDNKTARNLIWLLKNLLLKLW